uniref:uncharacterized protein LOC120340647 isoform X2 n=1 Tax=Styela clava TaxID=7725 RepID=UPI00193A573C|nr:uncharacterized protein LOC120340647 isoform X2 [Styela clava]
MEGNSPYITNLVNSIIGVSVLAMPFCLKQCGIILGLGLLFGAAWLTYISCSMLSNSAFYKRRRTYEYLALYTLGPTGKFTVELSMIGMMLGTCIAFYVVIGDLSNGILSRFIDGADPHTLRVFTIIFCALCIALPLAMMKNLSVLSYFGFFSLTFYLAFVVVVILNAVSNGLLSWEWISKVNLWRPAGMFQCLPIFSLAYACQCQLFIVYDSLEEPSVRRIEDIVSSAIKFVTVVYMSVGFFGYTTYQEHIAGNLLVSFPSNMLLDFIKLGFAMSVVLGFPLIIFPCRQSIHTLFFGKPVGEGLQPNTYIPPFLFKSITLTIVLSTMTVAIMIPNGRPHGQGAGDEDCPTDEVEGHDHGDHEDEDDHSDHEGHDHGDMGHGSEYDGKEGACPSSSHTFDGKHSYLTIMEEAPSFKNISACSYLTTDKQGLVPGVLGSLQHSEKASNFAVLGEKFGKNYIIRVNLEGQTRKFVTSFPTSTELHMCMVSSVADNTVTLFLNGKKTRTLKFPRLIGIPQGGVITIGKIENDKYPMYKGTIRNFMMWDRGLSEAEILKIVTMNHCPAGAKVTLLESEVVPQKDNVPSDACMGDEYTFDNSGDKVEYVEASQSISKMKFVTICVKVTTNMFGVIPGTIASYATKNQPEMISVGGGLDKDGAELRITVEGKSQILDGQFAPNTAYRFCLVYHLPHGHVVTHVDGRKARELQFSTMGYLPGGGSIIIGQHQRKLSGCFDKSKAYNGKLAEFTVWDRALTSEELMEMATKSICPTDAIVMSDRKNVVPHGKFYTYATCPSADFTLSNGPSITEYIVASQTIPDLDYVTTCSKVTTNAFGMIPGTIGSYATKDQPAGFMVGGEMGPNGPAFRVTVNGQSNVKDAQFMPNTEYSFCISLHLPHGHALTYINGRFSKDFEFKNPGSLAGNGKIIVGQKQGCVGGCFDAKSAFVGRVRDFTIWDRVLSVQEIAAIHDSNQCPTDQVVDSTTGNAQKVSKPAA